MMNAASIPHPSSWPGLTPLPSNILLASLPLFYRFLILSFHFLEGNRFLRKRHGRRFLLVFDRLGVVEFHMPVSLDNNVSSKCVNVFFYAG